jgi:tetratricopeptide (TPR) repeat protein
MAAPRALFERGLSLHRQGRLSDAALIYQDVLGQHPAHADAPPGADASLYIDALHCLGIIALQAGQAAEADALTERTIALKPDHPEAHGNRGNALRNLGRHEDAVASYDRAIALRPDFSEAHYNRGNALRDLGRNDEALSAYDAAIALKPDLAEAHFNRGTVLQALNRFDQAIASYDKVIALKPDDSAAAWGNRGNALLSLERYAAALANYDRAIASRPASAELHYNRGNALRNLNRHEEALASYDQAIALRPNYAEAYINRGNALADLGRHEEAVASREKAVEAYTNRGNAARDQHRPEVALRDYAAAIALRPDRAALHSNRGNALTDLKRYDEAVASYDTALALRPDFAEAHFNRGRALWDLERHEEAIICCDQALASRPDFAEAHFNRGRALWDLARIEEAMASYARAIALHPDYAAAHWNQSMCRLALGDYATGWEQYEWRWKSVMARNDRERSWLRWTGDFPIEGKTILVRAEQGYGDSLQFCRYVPLLAARATVVLEVSAPLRRLLAGLAGAPRVVLAGDALPRFDAWIPMLSLPHAFRSTLETIPASIPYLYADPERSAVWRRRLAALPGRKVGLVWAGSSRPDNLGANAIDRRRSMPLRHFAPLAAIPGICLISLQKGEPAAQARTPPAGMILHDWTDELADFADTAALVDNLDLVISVDTSVAHLAGALGKPVWVLNRFDQCWRWLRDRDDSPWYPSARLFRQRTPGDWAGVIDDVAAALRARE